MTVAGDDVVHGHDGVPGDDDILPLVTFRFHPREQDFPCMNATDFLIDNGKLPADTPRPSVKTPVYFRRQSQVLFGREHAVVGLFLVWRTNPGYQTRCFGTFGFHSGDVERIHVYYFDGEPKYVYFNAHGYGQGLWRKWSECEFDADGRLVAYVALGSHAMYPSAERGGERSESSRTTCARTRVERFGRHCRTTWTRTPKRGPRRATTR